MQNSIKVWSQTVIDDSGELSPIEYDGSFGCTVQDWQKVAIDGDKQLIKQWVKMMDCFHVRIIFLNTETNQMIEAKDIYPHEAD